MFISMCCLSVPPVFAWPWFRSPSTVPVARMQDQLMGWLESNSTLTEKAAEAEEGKTATKKKPAAKKSATKAKSEADNEG